MHYHLEIIMPPTDDVQKSIAEILAPFDENYEDEDGDGNSHAFWDWYVIGGRWAGAKVEAMVDNEKMKEFRNELTKRNVTVSGFVSGKGTLQPESQIPMVDALWNEFFPDSPVKVCPLFSNFHDQYCKDGAYGDIMPLNAVPPELCASKIIIAKHNYEGTGLQAEYMIEDSYYNGVSFMDSKWDGTLKTALDEYLEKIKIYRDEWREKNTPNGDWLVVTVDYHS